MVSKGTPDLSSLESFTLTVFNPPVVVVNVTKNETIKPIIVGP